MKRLRLAAAVIATTALLGGCGANEVEDASTPSQTPQLIEVLVTLDLQQYALDGREGDPCKGLGGYSDIRAGAQVKITDSTGRIVGLGALGSGQMVDNAPTVRGAGTCRFQATVGDVPAGDNVYGAEVANRGVVNFSPEGASASVVMTLG